MKKRGVDYPDEKFDKIHDRNSINILEMVTGLERGVWEKAYKEFREHHDLPCVQSIFSDLLTVLIVADDGAFPPSTDRITGIAYLAQIYIMIEAFYMRYGETPKTEVK